MISAAAGRPVDAAVTGLAAGLATVFKGDPCSGTLRADGAETDGVVAAVRCDKANE